MPIFSAESADLALQGPVVQVSFGVTQAGLQAMRDAGEPLPQPVVTNALIDTGASGSVVKKGLLTPLNLHPVGKTSVYTPTSEGVSCDLYAVQVGLPSGYVDVTVIEADLSGQPIQALIGRDVLSRGLLIYQGKTGQFTLAF